MNKIPDMPLLALLVGGPLHGGVLSVPELPAEFRFTAPAVFSHVYRKRSVWVSRNLSRIQYDVFMCSQLSPDSIDQDDLRSLIDEAWIPPVQIQSKAVF